MPDTPLRRGHWELACGQIGHTARLLLRVWCSGGSSRGLRLILSIQRLRGSGRRLWVVEVQAIKDCRYEALGDTGKVVVYIIVEFMPAYVPHCNPVDFTAFGRDPAAFLTRVSCCPSA